MLNLKDKNILILGATGGVGKSVASTLDKLGARLVLSGRNTKRLDSILQSLSGKNHLALPFDVREIEHIQSFMEDAIRLSGDKFDGLVYSVGVIPVMPIKNTTFDFLLNVMSVNFFAFVEFVRIFSNRKFHNKSSSIVTLSSFAGLNPDKGQLAYGASKGAMDSAIIAMAKELFSKEIRVNAIRPAIIQTDEALSERVSELVLAMGTGMINPDELATQVAFLLSEDSSGVYGRCFDVRGYLP